MLLISNPTMMTMTSWTKSTNCRQRNEKAAIIFQFLLLLVLATCFEAKAFVETIPAMQLRKNNHASSMSHFRDVISVPSIVRSHRHGVVPYIPLSSSLQLLPTDLIIAAEAETSSLKHLAETLGYLLGGASLLLYTPIAVRVLRQKSADGLTLSTWWLKLTSYTCTDVYNFKKGFPITAFSETLVITLEAVVILSLVSFYQKNLNGGTIALATIYLSLTTWALFSPENLSWGPPEELFALAQIAATILNTLALVPQLWQNYQRKSSGDYSAVTSTLAALGCSIRLFTTLELADGDLLLLFNYAVALLLNLSVLVQILWFGTKEEGKSVINLFLADVKTSEVVRG
mmetsp:Transcript_11782/g.24059  ORF Transcript_11782/g.24059 Transcript_11782/m.24059 type:complete len:344 (+) Transcript_11782:47-1078(+)